MRKWIAVCLFASCPVFAGACAEDDSGDKEGDAKVGHCTTDVQCFQVSMPDNYDLAAECSITKGTAGEGPCDVSMYEVECTEIVQVSLNGGPEEDVTYVYYRPANSGFSCAGLEFDL